MKRAAESPPLSKPPAPKRPKEDEAMPADLVLVHREEAIAATVHAWADNQDASSTDDAAHRPRGTVVFAGQRPGSGKTRLGHHLATLPPQTREALLQGSPPCRATIMRSVVRNCSCASVLGVVVAWPLSHVVETFVGLTGQPLLLHFDELQDLETSAQISQDFTTACPYGAPEPGAVDLRVLWRYYQFLLQKKLFRDSASNKHLGRRH
eukprot:m51a1_g6542 hypothetical protein (208) ;mRNA; f:60859-63438